MVPFWRGEQAGRSLDLGRAIGRFLGELAPRLDDPSVFRVAWSATVTSMPPRPAISAITCAGSATAPAVVPTDRRIVVEASRDPARRLAGALAQPPWQPESTLACGWPWNIVCGSGWATARKSCTMTTAS